MKIMKNVKKPKYALSLGKGVFAGTMYQCKYCGGRRNVSGGYPSPQKCSVSGGNCVYEPI